LLLCLVLVDRPPWGLAVVSGRAIMVKRNMVTLFQPLPLLVCFKARRFRAQFPNSTRGYVIGGENALAIRECVWATAARPK